MTFTLIPLGGGFTGTVFATIRKGVVARFTFERMTLRIFFLKTMSLSITMTSTTVELRGRRTMKRISQDYVATKSARCEVCGRTILPGMTIFNVELGSGRRSVAHSLCAVHLSKKTESEGNKWTSQRKNLRHMRQLEQAVLPICLMWASFVA